MQKYLRAPKRDQNNNWSLNNNKGTKFASDSVCSGGENDMTGTQAEDASLTTGSVCFRSSFRKLWVEGLFLLGIAQFCGFSTTESLGGFYSFIADFSIHAGRVREIK